MNNLKTNHKKDEKKVKAARARWAGKTRGERAAHARLMVAAREKRRKAERQELAALKKQLQRITAPASETL